MGNNQTVIAEVPKRKENANFPGDTFLMVNCEDKTIFLPKEVLDEMAHEYGIDINLPFEDKCRAIRKSVLNSEMNDFVDPKKPPLTISSFEDTKCSDLVRNYSAPEWSKFYNDNKEEFKDWYDLIKDHLSNQSPIDIPIMCRIAKNAMASKGLIKSSEQQQSVKNYIRDVSKKIHDQRLKEEVNKITIAH